MRGEALPLIPQMHAEALASIESQLLTALNALDNTIGRSRLDNEAIGATRMLVTKSIASIKAVRARIVEQGAA